MIKAYERFENFDSRLTRWLADHAVPILRLSVGVVFLWFGALKFFPALSPAEALASRTISELTFHLIPDRVILLGLAAWECLIGLGLITGLFLRFTLLILMLQMLGTFTPLFLFPSEAFIKPPFVPTLEGQYILKNFVLVAAGLVIGATVRGGKLQPDPARQK